jgi:hypothetical protein
MYAEAFWGVLAFGACLAVFYGPWQSLCTDWARQMIFESRDGIFDLAREGKLDFNSREYRQIRRSLETLIRFAHEFTWIHFCVLSAAMGYRQSTPSELSKAIEQISDEVTKAKVKRLVAKAQRSMILMMVWKSLPLILAFLFIRIRPLRDYIKPKARALREPMQIDAELVCP